MAVGHGGRNMCGGFLGERWQGFFFLYVNIMTHGNPEMRGFDVIFESHSQSAAM